MLIRDRRRKNVIGCCDIELYNTKILEVQQTKYLGIVLANNLTFRNNRTEVSNKIAKKLNVICRLGKSVSCYAKNLIYKTIIAPHIDYASSIMLNYDRNDIIKLQKIQNRGMRLVLEVNKYTRVEIMLESL